MSAKSIVLDPKLIPLALYIHIPWCVKKCPYCDFNSHESRETIDFAGYVDTLLADLDQQLTFCQGREISSIFIGGGTPSLLPIAQYQRLMQGIRMRLPLASDCETTMEANPATVEHAPFADYRQVGINRLSLGVQSFANEQLLALGRIHNPQQAHSAIINAQQAGFTRLNVDLMHGLPKQTTAQALADLQQCIALGVNHVSWYQLTIEPNTVFYRNTPILPNDEILADIFEQGADLLTQHGFEQYEVSAWTRPDAMTATPQPSRHNVNYWQFGDYLAIGAGAHGKVTTANGIYRFSKSRLPKDYMANQTAIGWQAISEADVPFEFMMNALRLKAGVPKSYWTARTGLDWQAVAPTLEALQERGLIVSTDECIQCTDTGFLFLNQVLAEFLPED